MSIVEQNLARAGFCILLNANMSAAKRKRGGQARIDKKAKRVKITDVSKVPSETEQEKKDEIAVPAPVSMVRPLDFFLASDITSAMLANVSLPCPPILPVLRVI